jgi:hypothetical protein
VKTEREFAVALFSVKIGGYSFYHNGRIKGYLEKDEQIIRGLEH